MAQKVRFSFCTQLKLQATVSYFFNPSGVSQVNRRGTFHPLQILVTVCETGVGVERDMTTPDREADRLEVISQLSLLIFIQRDQRRSPAAPMATSPILQPAVLRYIP
jgi:hypothetical protein